MDDDHITRIGSPFLERNSSPRATPIPPAAVAVKTSEIIVGLRKVLEIVEQAAGGDPTTKALFDMHYSSGLSFEVIAAELGIAQEEVRKRWFDLASGIVGEMSEAAESSQPCAAFIRVVMDGGFFQTSLTDLLQIVTGVSGMLPRVKQAKARRNERPAGPRRIT